MLLVLWNQLESKGKDSQALLSPPPARREVCFLQPTQPSLSLSQFLAACSISGTTAGPSYLEPVFTALSWQLQSQHSASVCLWTHMCPQLLPVALWCSRCCNSLGPGSPRPLHTVSSGWLLCGICLYFRVFFRGREALKCFSGTIYKKLGGYDYYVSCWFLISWKNS